MSSFIGLIVKSFAVAQVGPPTLAVALNSVADRLDNSIEKAGTRADEVGIRYGSEAWALVNNMRVAYKDALNTTVDKLDKSIRDNLALAQSAADNLEKNTREDMATLGKLVTQSALILPLSNKRPQITGWSPSYEVFRASKDSILVTIRGVFASADEDGMEPSMASKEGIVAIPIHITTQDIIFLLPRQALRPSGRSTSYSRLDVTIPYFESSGLLHLGHRRSEAHFQLAIVGLPESPGTIIVHTSQNVSVPRSKHVITIQDNQQSDRDDHDLDHCGPNEDWTINPSSVRIVFDRTEGSTSTNRFVRINNPSVCWHIRTEHHRFGTSDKVWFHFEYDATTTEQVAENRDFPLELHWGDSKFIDMQGKTYNISFVAFDGTNNQYGGPTEENRFLSVKAEGTGIRISARPPQALVPYAH